MSAANLIALGLQLIPQLIQAGMAIDGLLDLMVEVNSQTHDPTAEQWNRANAIKDALQEKLHSDVK